MQRKSFCLYFSGYSFLDVLSKYDSDGDDDDDDDDDTDDDNNDQVRPMTIENSDRPITILNSKRRIKNTTTTPMTSEWAQYPASIESYVAFYPSFGSL